MKTLAFRKNLTVGLIILLVGAFVVPGMAQGATIYVDDDNTAGPWDGTLGHPYQYIQDGIDNASSGDTVLVFRGTYNENVVVDKKINLMGQDKDDTIIDGNRLFDVIYVSADSVEISRFTIRKSGYLSLYSGIDVRSSHNTISGNVITNNYSGINLDQSSHNLIDSNTITNNPFSGIVLTISSDNSILDNDIQNTVYLSRSSNDNIISGNYITDCDRAIWLTESSSNNTISGNTITDNTCGVFLSDSSDNNTVIADIIVNNGGGIYVYDSYNSNITNNLIANSSEYGILVAESSENDTISGNTIQDNGSGGIHYQTDSYNITVVDNEFVSCGIMMDFSSLSYWNSLAIENNTVNGKPLRYYKNASGLVVPVNTGQLILANCTNFTVENLSLSNVDRGIHLAFSSYNDISADTTANNNCAGVLLYQSSHNTLSDNEITHNGTSGISFESHSDGNVVSGNAITDNNNGFYLIDSDTNTITGNAITSNTGYGIYLVNSCNNDLTQDTIRDNNSGGIYLLDSDNNNVAQNVVANNDNHGMNLSNSSNNHIYENAIVDNNEGISLSFSSNNTLYHNDFINKTLNAHDYGAANQWDDGYPSGGNYWGDYEGMDEDGDGIGDTAYAIPGDSEEDRYPLMYPWGHITVFVDDDADPSWYDSIHVSIIQEGVDSATDGGVVYVYNGTYYENVTADKRLHLIGQNVHSVFVDGSGSGDVISLFADSASIRGFTVQNSGSAGIALFSDFNTIFADSITDNGYGISLIDSSSNNDIYENSLTGNDYGIHIANSSDSSRIYHNNFVNNTQSAYDECDNQWDDSYPSGGNYWSDFDEPGEGAYDDNGDGIVDSAYSIPGDSNQDRYALMNPWHGTSPTPMCGDVDTNGVIDVGDLMYMINYLFIAGPEPLPSLCAGDVNCDGETDGGDVIRLIGYLFIGVSPPCDGCCESQ